MEIRLKSNKEIISKIKLYEKQQCISAFAFFLS